MTKKSSIFNFQSLIFLTIVILASFLRLYSLSSVPPSASLDEASIGYNAYSILKTGADEYGYKFPLLLRAYDDWRPALYVYLVIPFVKLFGLNVLAVRLPSVMLSILTVISTYFLVKGFFLTNSKFEIRNSKLEIPVIAAAMLAISPWHIYISRLGHEANAGLAFFIFGATFFIYRKIYLSFIFFALSFISYQSEKIVLPLFVLILLILFRKELFAMKKKVIFASIIALIILIPFIKETMSPNALVRFKATNVFTSQNERFFERAKLLSKAVEEDNILGKIIYNRRIVAGQIFLENYVSHFNPNWLFLNPSNDKHKVPEIGLMFIWEAPLILFGLIFLLRQKSINKIKILILTWILISPIPAAITTDAPHAMRAYTALPIPQILGALGICSIFLFLNERRHLISKYYLSKISLAILLLSISISLVYCYKQYFYVFPKTQSASFQYALSHAIPFVLENEKSYNKIVFSNQENLYQSYMFFLFYSKYDPYLYQKQGGTKSGGYAETHKFGKYEFKPVSKNEQPKSLIIGNINEISKDSKEIKTFKNMDGYDAIQIVEK